MKFRPFAEAKDYVHSLGLQSEKEWRKYCKSGRKPADIPYAPSRTYKKEWKGMGDWLGTGYIATGLGEFRPFEEAKVYVHSLGIKGKEGYVKYAKSGTKPMDIPANPVRIYEKEWISWGDWLGTGRIADQRLFMKEMVLLSFSLPIKQMKSKDRLSLTFIRGKQREMLLLRYLLRRSNISLNHNSSTSK